MTLVCSTKLAKPNYCFFLRTEVRLLSFKVFRHLLIEYPIDCEKVLLMIQKKLADPRRQFLHPEEDTENGTQKIWDEVFNDVVTLL